MKPRTAIRNCVRWAGWFVFLMVLWLLLTGTLDPQETAIGALVAAVAAVSAVVISVLGIIRWKIRPAWLLRLPALAWRIVADNWRVLSLLVRHLAGRAPVRGTFRALPFDPGGDDSLAATRRALITLAISISPNTYVVGIDNDDKVILCHQLLPSPKESAEEDVLGWL